MLAVIDRLISEPAPEPVTTRVLYISPLRALAVDIDKNLRAPLAGIALAAERLGLTVGEPRIAMRTGDTPARDRQRLIRHPPDLLITTPESLYLMLTSQAARTLAGVEVVIVDEIHALAPTKRGAHLAVSLERLERLTQRAPQRIGLSATQRPLSVTAGFLGGFDDTGAARPVRIVDAGSGTDLDVEVVVPIEDMSRLGEITTELRSGPASAALVERRVSIWPSILPEILARVMAHRSTIIFVNARRAAERLAAQLNELAERSGIGVDAETGELVEELFRAHHGSLARQQRIAIEDQLKRGELRAIVATSSLELGIDMGAVDLVIQVESPGAVSRGLQRIGRAGHQVGVPSRGMVFPKHRSDLLEAAVVVHGMRNGAIEPVRYLRSPLDVAAQQIVAMVAMTEQIALAEIAGVLRRSAPFAELSDELLASVLDLLSGRYPSEEFTELRPRIIWDRTTDLISPRRSAQRLAVTSGGTIPDRGLFGVFLVDGTRVGELDEEMVYESRPGEVFVLGASAWRIEQITYERVLVSPAPGEPGKMPYWHGDRPGRSADLGRAVGAFQRAVRTIPDPDSWLRSEYGLDELAALNVVRYLDDQAAATGVVPDDRTVVVERFRDEIGDWRVCILTPFGSAVHAPWALAIEHRLSEMYDIAVDTMWADDGIVIRLPEAAEDLDDELLIPDPDEIEDLVVAALPRTAMFSARFRECAARALLLPRRRPDQRTPLWQQRQRAADLLAVAARYPSFPILLEASRECLHDVFDLSALREVLRDLHSRRMRMVHVDSASASPMASSLLFGWIAAYMYQGDAPLAERRAAALALDRDLLHDLLGAEELRELLDLDAIATVEERLQGLDRLVGSADELHDVLVRVGDLTRAEIARRCAGAESDPWIAQLVAQRRIIEISIAQRVSLIAAEDASRYRDALGCMLPAGLPAAFTESVSAPLAQLIGRYGRTHGPFRSDEVAERFGVSTARVEEVLGDLVASQRLVVGEFRPGGVGREWCDAEVLRRLRRASLARLRDEVEPVDAVTLARFAPQWHQIPATTAGSDPLIEALGLLSGCSLVASALERDVLAVRVRDYRPAMLDQLLTSGEVIWVGDGSVGARDGRIRLYFADQFPGTIGEPADFGPLHDAIRQRLASQGASFLAGLRLADTTDTELLGALWDLVWAGEVTNDSLAPLRAMLTGGRTEARHARLRRPGLPTRTGPPAGAGRWSLTATLAQPDADNAYTRAQQLIERHGVLTREAVGAEGIPGGFAEVYRILRVLEERGRVRRGYFVAGLGAAQFALAGAVDRLRSLRPSQTAGGAEPAGEIVVLAATDPAQLYGSVLDWPDTAGRPARRASAVVVLCDGHAVVWFDRRSHHLVVFPAALTSVQWPRALADLVPAGRATSVEIRKIDGLSLGESRTEPTAQVIVEILRSAGYSEGYRGLVAPRPNTTTTTARSGATRRGQPRP